MKEAVIAVDVGGNNIRAAIVDANGGISFRQEEPTVSNRSFTGVCEQIRRFASAAISRGQSDGLLIRGVGISVPGYIRHRDNLITFAPNFKDFRNVSFYEALRRDFSVPILIENDGNCHALGEWWKGKGEGLRHVLALILGTGVGGGIILDGRIVRGASGAAGELGHMVVDPNGPLCGCEGNGCLEAYASATAMERKFGRTPLQIEQDARNGDATSIEAYREVGRALGIAISSLCTILEPELVVLAGKISKGYDLFLPSIRQETDRRLKNHPMTKVRIEQAKNIDDAGILGAAWLAFQGNP